MKHIAVLFMSGIAAGLSLTVSTMTPAAAAPVRQTRTTVPDIPLGHLKTNATLNVDKAPIRLVLRILFRRSGQSFVLGPHVTGTVTAKLHNVPFSQAVSTVISANSVPLVEKMANGIYVINAKQQPPLPQPTRRFNRRMSRRYTRPAYVPTPVVRPPFMRRTTVLPGAGNIRVVP